MSRRGACLGIAVLGATGCYDLGASPFQLRADVEGVTVERLRQIGGAGEESAVVDAFSGGGVVAAGTFGAEVRFGGQGELDLVSAAEGHGGYVVSLDGKLEPRWTRRLLPKGDLRVHDVAAIDDEVGAVVVGAFGSALLFGPDEPTPLALPAGPEGRTFVARFDPLGALAWALAEGGSAGSRAWAVAGVAKTIVVGGSFEGSAAFGEGTAKTLLAGLPSGATQAFVATYGVTGDLRWVIQTEGEAEIRDVVIGQSESLIYATGWSRGETVLGHDADEQPVLASGGDDEDAFVAAYDLDTGELRWHQILGGGGDAEGTAVDVSASGVVVAGIFRGAIEAGNQKVQAAESSQDAFVARFLLDGEGMAWLRAAHGYRCSSEDVALLADGSVLLSGSFVAPDIRFGDDLPSAPRLRSDGLQQDGFVVRYDGAGAHQWALRFGGADRPRDTVRRAVVSGDAVLLAGDFDGELTLGSEPGGEPLLRAVADGSDAFVMRVELGTPGD